MALFQDAQHLNAFTSEQALGDYAVLINHLKSTIPGASESPVIAFGGSYGGMLSAWFRIKYPHIVNGWLEFQSFNLCVYKREEIEKRLIVICSLIKHSKKLCFCYKIYTNEHS